MNSLPLDKVQGYMDMHDKMCCDTMDKHHKEVMGGKMSDMKYSHMQHEASESPAYERKEEMAVKMMGKMKGKKGY